MDIKHESIGYVCGCVEEGKDGSRVYVECRNRSVLDVVKFSTLRNTKETLANFSKISRVSLSQWMVWILVFYRQVGPMHHPRPQVLNLGL